MSEAAFTPLREKRDSVEEKLSWSTPLEKPALDIPAGQLPELSRLRAELCGQLPVIAGDSVEEWQRIFERLFISKEVRKLEECDLIIFVQINGKLAPRRAKEDGTVKNGIPEDVDWRESLILNLALHAEFVLQLGTGRGAAVSVELRTFAAVDREDGERSYPYLTFAPADSANMNIALTDRDGFTVTLAASKKCPIAIQSSPIFSACVTFSQLSSRSGGKQSFSVKLKNPEEVLLVRP